MPLGLYVCNVGQGQYITCIGGDGNALRAVIIDAGIRGDRLAKWLRDLGVRRLPAIVLTHNHRDHIQGAAWLAPGLSWCGYRTSALSRSFGSPITRTRW
jgi:competence protein ComEC